jgi:transcriptional regulator with XRE-family HTH domain
MSDLQAFRAGLALTQSGMARLLGVDRAHLSRLERGERRLTGEQTIRFNLLRNLAREAILADRIREVARS